MEETALKRVLWVVNSRMELQISPLLRGSGLPRTSTLVIIISLFSVLLNLAYVFLGHSFCFFGFSKFLIEVFGFMVLWYSQLTLTAAVVSVAQHATESHSIEG